MATATDNFTGSNGTDLTAHTADTGESWSNHASFSGSCVIISNRIRNGSATQNHCCYSSFTPASADYSVQATLRQMTDTGTAGVAGRIATGANTMYLARYVAGGTNAWQCHKVVAGSVTLLGSAFSETLSNGDERVVKLEMIGTAIKVYIDGVEQISATDNAISAAGVAGVQLNNNSGGDAANLHLDAWSVSDVVVATGVLTLTYGVAHEPERPILGSRLYAGAGEAAPAGTAGRDLLLTGVG